MRIAVVAANGRTGQKFVELALSNGHQVRAGVYKKSIFTRQKNLEIIKCDATQKKDLERLISGQDGVVSFIGHVKDSAPNVQTDAINNIIEVMNKLKLKRLISLTGTGVRFEGDNITLIDRLLNLSIRLIDGARVRDGIQHVEALKSSNLDWTVVRVLKLQNSKPDDFKLSLNGPTKNYVSRYEVAIACLQVLEQDLYIKQAPIISKS